MSDTPASAHSEEAGEKSKKKSKLPLIIGLVVLLVTGGGGAYWFLVMRPKAAAAKEHGEEKEKGAKEEKAEKEEKKEKKSAHEEADEEAPDEETADEESEEEPAKKKKGKSFSFTPPNDKEVKHVIELQPFIVNLADQEGSYYLRMTVSIGVGESKEEKPDPLFTTRVRNAILAVLTTKTSEDVLTPEGKTALRRELLKVARKAVAEPEVHAIYITDLIVQL
jgi:flagellar FliL protein